MKNNFSEKLPWLAINRSSLIWFIAYFLIAACIGIFIRDIPGQPELFSSIENFMAPASVTQLGDPNSFALGAKDIYHNGWFSVENQWLIKLWPPGFMVTKGIVLKVFGLKTPFIFILILLSSILVALLLAVVRLNLLVVIPPLAASLIPLAPFLFPVTRMFLLQPGGIILGEGFAIIFFLLSMKLAPLAIRNNSIIYATLAGLALALAAYFRSQFELFVTFLSLMAFVLAVAYYSFLKTKMSGVTQQYIARAIKMIVVVLFSAHCTMAPWRLHNLYDPTREGNASWVLTQNLVFANAGRTDEELIKRGGGWLVLGGSNVACKVEPNYCGKSKKTKFYKAFLHHPIDWTLYKLKLFPDYWFSSLKNYTSVQVSASVGDLIINAVVLFFVFFNVFLLLRIRRHPDFLIYAWGCLAFYACNLIIFLLVHYETRYFYALKIYAIFTFVSLSAITWSLSASRRVTGMPVTQHG